MATQAQVQYVCDEHGNQVSVIVPVALWREILAHQETAYLCKSETMRQRLVAARNRTGGMSLEEVRTQLGI